MIGEALSIINSNPQLTDDAYLRHKAAVVRTAISGIPESIRQSTENFKTSRRRALGATALAATNVALLYGDDVAFYNVFSQMKDSLEASATGGTAAAMIAAGGLSAVTQIALARKNQKFTSVSAETESGSNQGMSEVKPGSFLENMRNRFQKTKQHVGKLAVSLSVGVPLNALSRRLSQNEVYGHAAAYGVASAFAYETANVSLGVLDSPVAPAILVGGILASRYAANVCERAATVAEVRELNESNLTFMSEEDAETIVAYGK